MTIFQYAHLSIFQGLSNEQLDRLKPLLVQKKVCANEVIFEQNQAAGFIYILLTGEVSIVYKPDDGPAWVVTRILPGDIFGWSAAVGRATYTSSAIALTESLAFCITGKGLEIIFEQDPETGAIFLENLANGIAVRTNNTRINILSILNQKWLHQRA